MNTGAAGSHWVRRNDRCGGRQEVCGGRQNVCGGTKKVAADQKKVRQSSGGGEVVEKEESRCYEPKISAA